MDMAVAMGVTMRMIVMTMAGMVVGMRNLAVRHVCYNITSYAGLPEVSSGQTPVAAAKAVNLFLTSQILKRYNIT